MKEFEEDLLSLISNITFRDVNDPFLKKFDEDIKKVNSSKNVFVLLTKQQICIKLPQRTTTNS